jgi:catechol 2,3-dioxygenase-like lactoylglutathione lyase family enzyme
MLGDAELVAFAPSSDLDRARRFYGETLELPLLEQTPFACVFRAPNATLRVTLVGQAAQAPYTVLGWNVPDIETAARQLAQRGIEPLRYGGLEQDRLGVWRSPSGTRVVWFKDPDDNVLSLSS